MKQSDKIKKSKIERLVDSITELEYEIETLNGKNRMLNTQYEEILKSKGETNDENKTLLPVSSVYNDVRYKYDALINHLLERRFNKFIEHEKTYSQNINDHINTKSLLKLIKIELAFGSIQERVKYLNNHREEPLIQLVIINDATTFSNIHDYACMLWEVDPSKYCICDNNNNILIAEMLITIEQFFKNTVSNQKDDFYLKVVKKVEYYSNLEKQDEIEAEKFSEEQKEKIWIVKLLNKYTGLFFYQRIQNSNDSIKDGKKMHTPEAILRKIDTSSHSFLFIILILLLSFFSILGKYTATDERWLIHSINQTLSGPYDVSSGSIKIFQFITNTHSPTQISQYLHFISPLLFKNVTSKSIQFNNHFISPIIFKIARTKQFQCRNKLLSSSNCYHYTHNNSTANTTLPSYIAELNAHNKIQFEVKPSKLYKINGDDIIYSGPMIYASINPLEENMEYFDSIADKIFQQQLNDEESLGIRAIEISFTLFNPYSNLIANVHILFERSSSGKFKDGQLKTKSFRLNIYINNDWTFYVDTARLILSAYILAIIQQIVQKFKKNKSSKLNPFATSDFILRLIIDTTLIAGLISSYIFDLYLSKYDIDYAMNYTVCKINYNEFELDQNNSKGLSEFILLIILVRGLSCFHMHRGLSFTLGYVVSMCKSVFLYFVGLVPLMMSLGFLLLSVWGPYIPSFTNYMYSLISIVLMCSGTMDMYQMLSYSPLFGVIFICLIYLVSYYLLFAAILSIISIRYQEHIKREGYIIEQEQHPELSIPKRFLRWIASCLPKRTLLRKIDSTY